MISILTPTYNDAESIEQTFLSIQSQTLSDWEWILINDGSTDHTDEVVKKIIEKYQVQDKITYIKQENKDQLNAILTGIKVMKGEYEFTLHSDDLLPNEHFLEDCVNIMDTSPQCAGLFGDLILMDEDGKQTGIQTVKDYRIDPSIPPLMLLWLGRNLYSDVAFHRSEVFKTKVKDVYLTWNMPLWLDFKEDAVDMLPYQKAPFPVLKYRIHSGNYINNEIGKRNVINGELRTALQLMHYYEIWNYRSQYTAFRLYNKLKKHGNYPVKYHVKETKNKYEILQFIIGKRYPEGVEGNLFLEAILGFYQNQKNRTYTIAAIPKDIPIYYGKDVRFFQKKLMDGTLEPFYIAFMQEMKQGFSILCLKDARDREKLQAILKFMCINHDVIIK